MPFAVVYYYGEKGDETDLLASGIADSLSDYLVEYTKSPATVDTHSANRRFVKVPAGMSANDKIVVAVILHGGQLLTDEAIEHIGRAITSTFGEWKLLLTVNETEHWFANGNRV